MGNVPALRFEGFVGEWNIGKLGDKTQWLSGGTPSKQNLEYWDGDIPWISAASMRGHYYSDSDVKVTQKGVENGTRLAKKGSVLLLVRGSMLFNKIPVGIATSDVSFNQDVKAITPNKEINNLYLLYWFLSSENKLLHTVTGTGIGAGKLDTPDLKAMRFAYPQSKEQQKIANFLTTVDTKIQQLQQKQTLLQQYKKGVMQQLFSQALRFKDDERGDYPDWEEKRLGDVAKITSGGTPNRGNGIYWSGDIPWITTALIDFNEIVLAEEYISEEGLKSSSAKIFPAGTVLIAMYGQGKTRGKVAMLGVEASTNQACAALLIKPSVYPLYIYYYLSGKYADLRNLSNDGGQKNLSGGLIKRFKVSIPSFQEQQKIVNFLTAIDNKITQTTQQLEQAQIFKKGLLQQMFV